MERQTSIDASKAATFLNGLPCPDDCPTQSGRLQVIKNNGDVKLLCIEPKCKLSVDVDSVKVVYEDK